MFVVLYNRVIRSFMLFSQIHFALAYFKFNGIILRCTCLTRYTGFTHLICLFLNYTLFGCFVPSGQVISVCVSTFTVFTTGLVVATVFTELNMSICFLASVYEIPLSALLL